MILRFQQQNGDIQLHHTDLFLELIPVRYSIILLCCCCKLRRWNILFQNYLPTVKGFQQWNACSLLLSEAKSTCMDKDPWTCFFTPSLTLPHSSLSLLPWYLTHFCSLCVLFSSFLPHCQLKGRKCAHVLYENSMSAVKAVLLAGRDLKRWSFKKFLSAKIAQIFFWNGKMWEFSLSR